MPGNEFRRDANLGTLDEWGISLEDLTLDESSFLSALYRAKRIGRVAYPVHLLHYAGANVEAREPRGANGHCNSGSCTSIEQGGAYFTAICKQIVRRDFPRLPSTLRGSERRGADPR